MPRRTLAEEIAAARKEAGLPPLEPVRRKQKNPHRLKVVEASSGIPQEGIPRESTLRPAPRPGGYYPTFNELDDRIIPELKLDTYEQSVLRRLYRLSRGWQSQTCTVGLTKIAKACAISRSRTQEAVASLLSRGLIQVVTQAQEGSTYRVLPDVPAVPPPSIPEQGIPQQKQGVPREDARGIPGRGKNKDNKGLINTDKKDDEKLMDAEEIKRILAEGK